MAQLLLPRHCSVLIPTALTPQPKWPPPIEPINHRFICDSRRPDYWRCRISSSSSSPSAELPCLAAENGWQVRRLEAEDQYEMREVARIQAEAFHDPTPVLDHLFFQFFQAEVLAGLIYKLRNSHPNRYACLVAESPETAGEVVGVVDLTALRDGQVLQHLGSEAAEYMYLSGLAVPQRLRRRRIASSLLKACDAVSALWGFEFLVLRVYEDDTGARRLYTKAGYRAVAADPPWFTTWIGRKRRILMVKRSNQHLLGG